MIRVVRLTGCPGLRQRITQELYDLMSNVSSQIQRAISEAIYEQVLPHIQATLRSGRGQTPRRGRKFRSSSRDELPSNLNRNEDLQNTHCKYPPILFSTLFKFLTLYRK